MKTCSKCGVPKDEFKFHLRSTGGARRAACKECEKIDRKKNHRASHLKQTYGLLIPGYEKMLREQQGNCAICSDTMTKPHVDHCHATGKIRALLCSGCNTALGGLKDSSLRCFLAASYLQKHST